MDIYEAAKSDENWAQFKKDNLAMDKEEFCRRFVAHMITLFPDGKMSDGEPIEHYATATAPAYWDEADLRVEGPEECAESDASEFGDE